MPRTIRSSERIRTQAGFKDCGQMCSLCPFTCDATEHTNPKTGQSWKINTMLDCKSINVIYKIWCIRCTFVYMGETQRRLQDRATQHRGYVARDEDHPVGEHFNSKGHSMSDMRFVAIEQVRPIGDTLLRRQRERLWINNYDSIESGGNRRR